MRVKDHEQQKNCWSKDGAIIRNDKEKNINIYIHKQTLSTHQHSFLQFFIINTATTINGNKVIPVTRKANEFVLTGRPPGCIRWDIEG